MAVFRMSNNSDVVSDPLPGRSSIQVRQMLFQRVYCEGRPTADMLQKMWRHNAVC